MQSTKNQVRSPLLCVHRICSYTQIIGVDLAFRFIFLKRFDLRQTLKPKHKTKFSINREFVIYGLIMGVLIVVLQVLNYETVIHRLSSDTFSVAIAVIFTGIGLWIGFMNFNKSKSSTTSNADIGKSFGLSKREMEVLVLIADGHSNQEIADKLFVSLNTIKTHLSNIFSKLNVQRRTQAVQKARDHKII